MRINTNVSSLVTQNYLRQTNNDMEDTMNKLSSGQRINSASDDAAGLAISTRMEAAIRGMSAAKRNSQDGISLIQTTESAMGTISNILQRMRELAVQADNGTNGTTDVASLQDEFNQLISEINHISDTTKFNGIDLLNTDDLVTLHVSNLSTDVMSVSTYNVDSAALGLDTNKTLKANGGSQTVIDAIDTALNSISDFRAQLGAKENRLNFTIDNLSVSQNNLSAAKSRIQDADMASQMSRLTRNKIIAQSAISMLSQANQNPQMIQQLLRG